MSGWFGSRAPAPPTPKVPTAAAMTIEKCDALIRELEKAEQAQQLRHDEAHRQAKLLKSKGNKPAARTRLQIAKQAEADIETIGLHKATILATRSRLSAIATTAKVLEVNIESQRVMKDFVSSVTPKQASDIQSDSDETNRQADAISSMLTAAGASSYDMTALDDEFDALDISDISEQQQQPVPVQATAAVAISAAAAAASLETALPAPAPLPPIVAAATVPSQIASFGPRKAVAQRTAAKSTN